MEPGAGIAPVGAGCPEVRVVKRLLVLLAVLAALAAPLAATAHPLGNFTINRYSRIEPSGNRVYVLYVLDLAEIPTFQAKPQVADGHEARAPPVHLEVEVRDDAADQRAGRDSA